jgi:hypothetical protein
MTVAAGVILGGSARYGFMSSKIAVLTRSGQLKRIFVDFTLFSGLPF